GRGGRRHDGMLRTEADGGWREPPRNDRATHRPDGNWRWLDPRTARRRRAALSRRRPLLDPQPDLRPGLRLRRNRCWPRDRPARRGDAGAHGLVRAAAFTSVRGSINGAFRAETRASLVWFPSR